MKVYPDTTYITHIQAYHRIHNIHKSSHVVVSTRKPGHQYTSDVMVKVNDIIVEISDVTIEVSDVIIEVSES